MHGKELPKVSSTASSVRQVFLSHDSRQFLTVSSQNIAEIDEIPLVEHIHAVEFSASERAIYLELDHHLRLQELKMKKTGGRAKNDRTRRLDDALGESR